MPVLKAVAMGVVAACGTFLGQIGPTQPCHAYDNSHRQAPAAGAPGGFFAISTREGSKEAAGLAS